MIFNYNSVGPSSISEALAKHHQQQQQQHHQHRSSLPGGGATNGDPHRGISPLQSSSGPTRKKHRSRRNSQQTLTANELTATGQKSYNEMDRSDNEKCKNALEKSSEIQRGTFFFYLKQFR